MIHKYFIGYFFYLLSEFFIILNIFCISVQNTVSPIAATLPQKWTEIVEI